MLSFCCKPIFKWYVRKQYPISMFLSGAFCCDCLAATHVDKKFQTEYNKGQILSWLERRASDRKFAGSMPVLGITSLCPWERHLTLIS